MKFENKKLANGLEIVAEYRPSAESVAIGFFTKTGARDEEPQIAGVSHFLEHMMFKGTATKSALDVTYLMGDLGAQANAFTSEENTVYYMAVLPEYFKSALSLLSDMLRPSLDSSEFDLEKKVILEEIALYQDRPTYVLLEKGLQVFFGVHPAGNSVLGTNETITALTRMQMKDYFDSRYSPSNMVLSVAGNFCIDELFDLAEEYCGKWENVPVSRAYPEFSPVLSNPLELKKQGIGRAYTMLLGNGPSIEHPLRFEMDVLTTILGDSSGSKAYWDLIDTGLCDSVSIESEQMDGVGVVYAYASTDVTNINLVQDRLINILKNAREFTDDDLQRAITKTVTRVVFQTENNMRRMINLGMDWLYLREYMSPKEELDRIKSISRESINKLLDSYPFTDFARAVMLPD